MKKTTNPLANGPLWAVWGLATAFVLLRFGLSPTGGQTNDSFFYLKTATQLLRGEPLAVRMPNMGIDLEFNSLWPLGYPLSIALLGFLTRLPAWQAAVAVALCCMAGVALLLHRYWKQQAWVLALVLCLQYKIFSFVWSEGLFMLVELAYCHALYAAFRKPEIGWKQALGLVMLGFGLYFVRYAGFVAVLPPALLALFFFFWKKDRRKAAVFSGVSAGVGMLIGAYFLLNHYLSGVAWGGERFVYTEPLTSWLGLLGRGLFNEGLLIRDYDFTARPDYAAGAGLLLQLFVFGRILKAYRGHQVPPQQQALLWFYVGGGLIQLLTPAVLRKFSPFDDLDLRLLGPATFFLLLAGLGYLSSSPVRWKSIEKWVILLIITSLLAGLLPKHWIHVYGYTRYFFS